MPSRQKFELSLSKVPSSRGKRRSASSDTSDSDSSSDGRYESDRACSPPPSFVRRDNYRSCRGRSPARFHQRRGYDSLRRARGRNYYRAEPKHYRMESSSAPPRRGRGHQSTMRSHKLRRREESSPPRRSKKEHKGKRRQLRRDVSTSLSRSRSRSPKTRRHRRRRRSLPQRRRTRSTSSDQGYQRGHRRKRSTSNPEFRDLSFKLCNWLRYQMRQRFPGNKSNWVPWAVLPGAKKEFDRDLLEKVCEYHSHHLDKCWYEFEEYSCEDDKHDKVVKKMLYIRSLRKNEIPSDGNDVTYWKDIDLKKAREEANRDVAQRVGGKFNKRRTSYRQDRARSQSRRRTTLGPQHGINDATTSNGGNYYSDNSSNNSDLKTTSAASTSTGGSSCGKENGKEQEKERVPKRLSSAAGGRRRGSDMEIDEEALSVSSDLGPVVDCPLQNLITANTAKYAPYR